MLTRLHNRKKLQLILGLFIGIIFGIFLQKGGATNYDIILAQLLLTDFTVLKIMLSAVATGMIGIYFMKGLGWVQLNPKPGSVGTSVVGGLIFGVGFATLGYCPGTIAGAIGHGFLDALVGGLLGILIGASLFAAWYPRLNRSILKWVDFGNITIPELLKVNPWLIIGPVVVFIVLLLRWIENAGF
jgi:hypothetical protein